MTNLQIEYWKNRENVRHNMAMERLTGEAQSEQARHNVESERVGYAQAYAAQLQAENAARLGYLQFQLASYERKKLNAEANLTQAKAEYQTLQNSVYKKYGEGMYTSQLYNVAADTELKYAQSGSYSYTNFNKTTSSFRDLFGVAEGIITLLK